MKKIISILTVLCLICMSLVPVYAVEHTTIYYNKVTGNTGDNVQIGVGIKNNIGLAGLLLRIEYNPNEISINSITNGTAFQSAMFTPPDTSIEIASPFVVSWVSLSGMDNDGTILNIDATLKKSFSDEYAINVVSYEANDIDENDVKILVDNGAAPIMYCDTAEARQGETIDIPIKIEHNPGISSLGINISYDDNAIKLNSIENGDLLSGAYFEYGDISKNTIPLNWAGIDDKTNDGIIAILNFTVSDKAELGATSLYLNVNESLNKDEVDVPLWGLTRDLNIISSAPVTQEYEIIFKNWDGTELQKSNLTTGTMPVYSGITPTKPSDDKYSYPFVGWSPKVTEVTGAATYTASFTTVAREYTITLNTNGGTINSGNVNKYTYGVGANLPADMKRDNYIFAGWYENSDFSGTVVSAISIDATGDKTYYAKWTPNEYIVTFNTNGGTINSGGFEKYTYGVGANLPSDITKDNYKFGGWYENSDFSGTVVSAISRDASGNKTYYAKWTPNEYTVVFNTNGGIINSGTFEKYTYGMGEQLPTDVKRDNYYFDGWYDNNNCEGEAVVSIPAGSTGNKEYWAKWVQEIPVQHMISFINWDNTILQTEKVEAGVLPVYKGEIPIKNGDDLYSYVFAGWTPNIEKATGVATYKAVYTQYIKPLIENVSVKKVNDNNSVKMIINDEQKTLNNLKLYVANYSTDRTLKNLVIIPYSQGENGEIEIIIPKGVVAGEGVYKLMLWEEQQNPIISSINLNNSFFEAN